MRRPNGVTRAGHGIALENVVTPGPNRSFVRGDFESTQEW